MRRFAKLILILVGILLVIYGLAILGLNIYLQSAGLQAKIRAAAESAAGSPVQIQGTHYTPWSGFSVTGIAISGPPSDDRLPVLSAKSVSFRLDFLALLQGKLVLSEVVVSDPVFVARAIDLEPPAEGRTAGADVSAPKPQAPVAPSAAEPVAPSAAAPAAPPAAPHPHGPSLEIRRVRIENGTIQCMDSRGGLAATFRGLQSTSKVSRTRTVSGRFEIESANIGACLRPEHLRGTYSWSGGNLSVGDFQGDWAGGKLTGTFHLAPGRRFAATLGVEGVLLKQLAQDAGLSGEGTRGSLFGKASIEGIGGRPETFTGRAVLSLQQARFQPLDFIRQVGEILGIEELQMLELKTAEASFTVRDRKVVTDSLVLESANLVLDAKGPTSFEGKMKIQARLHLNERLRRDLAGLLADNFKDSEREGYQQLPFSITGMVSRPKTDLLDKLTGFRIGGDVGGLLKNFFRPPQEKKPHNPPGAGEGGSH